MRYHVMDGINNTLFEESSDKVFPFSSLKTEFDLIQRKVQNQRTVEFYEILLFNLIFYIIAEL